MRTSYWVKKTERLASALYLITGFVASDEPLCRLLRQKGLAVLSDMHQVAKQEQRETIERARGVINDALSLLAVAEDANLVSRMNADIVAEEYIGLRRELDAALSNMRSRPQQPVFVAQELGERSWRKAPHAPSLSEDAQDSATLHEYLKDISDASYEKDTHENHNVHDFKKTSATYVSDKRHVEDSARSQEKGLHIAVKRQKDRRAQLLQLLHEKPRISIKDASRVIHDCSEKTLQRELLALVDQGVLKKEGERRWSTYSLV